MSLVWSGEPTRRRVYRRGRSWARVLQQLRGAIYREAAEVIAMPTAYCCSCGHAETVKSMEIKDMPGLCTGCGAVFYPQVGRFDLTHNDKRFLRSLRIQPEEN